MAFFKKVVIADRLAIFVNSIYNNPQDQDGVFLLIATVFFAVQIYCDFSGYSDIAIGGAKVLGFDLMENFRSPYFSKSISEFWSRWHISLSTWFRDYVYIPLGGSRVRWPRHLTNLLITFLISGLWHGANWTFVIWGCLHGSYLISETLIAGLVKRSNKLTVFSSYTFVKWMKLFVTFTLVNIGWVFFRAASLKEAMYILNQIIFKFNVNQLTYHSLFSHGLDVFEFVIAIFAIVFLIGYELLTVSEKVYIRLEVLPSAVRFCFYYLLIMTVFLLTYTGSQEFIYFQF